MVILMFEVPGFLMLEYQLVRVKHWFDLLTDFKGLVHTDTLMACLIAI